MKPFKRPYCFTVLASSILVLTACGGGKTTTQQTNPNNNQSTTPLAKSALQKAGSAEKFADYYQLGINNLSTAYAANASVATTTADTTSSTSTATENKDSSTTSFGVSSTNLIESGVDEADFVKQNQDYIFTVSAKDANALVNVFKKPNTTAVGELTLANKNNTIGVFLANDKLVTITNTYMPMWIAENVAASRNGNITLDTISISNPSSPSIAKSYTWEGSHKTSRRIGNYVYIVSSASINNPYECMYTTSVDTSTASSSTNTTASSTGSASALPAVNSYCGSPKKLTAAEIAERMPVAIDGNKVKPADCFIPAHYKDTNASNNAFNTNITLITKIDITEKTQPTTTCVAASAEHVYMSPNALYLAGTDYASQNSSNTIISKFDIKNNTVNYAASGKVQGHINWTSPSFSMNEYKGVLRVATTKYDSNGNIINMLHTLKPSNTEIGALGLLASIPNATNTKAIGKPQERIQGIRFLGDEGYVVTFRNTDPLYKIDLTDPTNPNILGELEMPGYSAYLHRINEKYLLGVGYAASETGRIKGIQTTVFDTSNDNPVIVSQDSIQMADEQRWYHLPLTNDSRAITTISDKNAGTMRVAFPFRIDSNYNYQDSAQEYQIDMTTGKLLATQKRIFNYPIYYKDSRKRRALIDGDDIYYNYENTLVKYGWNKP